MPLSGFALQFNKNTFGLVPETPGKLGDPNPHPNPNPKTLTPIP